MCCYNLICILSHPSFPSSRLHGRGNIYFHFSLKSQLHIVTPFPSAADYMAVGNRGNSFVHLARFIAQFPEYTFALLDHLVDSKVAHWDPQIRELAASSLAALADVAPDYMIRNLLPRLVDMATSKDMETR